MLGVGVVLKNSLQIKMNNVKINSFLFYLIFNLKSYIKEK